MVEPPGIAPGSGPLISSAFIAIVRASPNGSNIGTFRAASKHFGMHAFSVQYVHS